MVDEHATTYENPFKFSGKELDDITGHYDHGARSRDPKLTMWYGVDPLFERYPDFSPYAYCMGNPVRFVDPWDGRGVYKTTTADGEVVKEIDSEKTYYIDDEGTWEKVDAPTEAKHEKPTEAPKQKISKEEENRQNAEMLAKYRAMKGRISSDPANQGGQKEGGSFTKQDMTAAGTAIGVIVALPYVVDYLASSEVLKKIVAQMVTNGMKTGDGTYYLQAMEAVNGFDGRFVLGSFGVGVGEGLFENFILPTSPDASPMLPLPIGMEAGRQMGYILWGSYSVLKK